MSTSPTKPRTTLSDLSKFTYGTTGLGAEELPIEDRVKVTRAAMDAGVWFHTSDTYGTAMSVLAKALDQDRARTPNLMIKIGLGANTLDDLGKTITSQMATLGIDRMQMGQLCIGGELADAVRNGGKGWDDLRALREKTKVDQFVLEAFPWTSDAPYDALRSGNAEGLIAGVIFYFNPLQRFVSNKLWELIQEKNFPILALRTVGGGDVLTLRDVPGAAWQPYLHDRAVEVAPLYEASDCKTWTEFCMRFVYGFPQVQTTIGSTTKLSHLNTYLDTVAVNDLKPLPTDIQSEIVKLQYRWSDETDMLAEPWTM
jgi:aryl-alcohol dehydrogenase-like predicted oxidoreductase